MAESRRGLSIQAAWWRALGKIGMWIHHFPVPKPKVPQFSRRFTPSTAKGDGDGFVELHFYVREDYSRRMEGERFPIIVNFHGGGFTLGTALDDGRWGRCSMVFFVPSCTVHSITRCSPQTLWTRCLTSIDKTLTPALSIASFVLQEVRAVFVSVEYRLAPQHPFPAAVQDGFEALLYLANNQEGFGIDASQMILSGFSAGGNMTFSIPLKLHASLEALSTTGTSPIGPKLTPHNIPRVMGIISFYPILDYSIPRDEKRAASMRPEKCLPKVFTNLFDAAYLPNDENLRSHFVSPALASDEMLNKALPNDIVLYLCEWDMLLAEGKLFAQRLEQLGKRVTCTIIEEEKHAFDKMPAFVLNPKVEIYYREACTLLNRMLSTESKRDDSVDEGNQGTLATNMSSPESSEN